MRAMMFGALMLLGALAAPSKAQGHRTVDARTRADLERVRDDVWRAWFAGDSATLNQILAGALAAGDENGWSDRQGAIDESRQFVRDGGTLLDLTFDSTSIDLQGKVAIMTSHFRYNTADRAGKRKTTSGHAVEIFVLEKGAWTHPFWHLAR